MVVFNSEVWKKFHIFSGCHCSRLGNEHISKHFEMEQKSIQKLEMCSNSNFSAPYRATATTARPLGTPFLLSLLLPSSTLISCYSHCHLIHIHFTYGEIDQIVRYPLYPPHCFYHLQYYGHTTTAHLEPVATFYTIFLLYQPVLLYPDLSSGSDYMYQHT